MKLAKQYMQANWQPVYGLMTKSALGTFVVPMIDFVSIS